jgi:parallel beta-helix repeat protein
MHKGGTGMKKGKVVSKIFGIALVGLMIGAMLGGLPALVSQAEASPATIYVPDDYPTIQAAVNAASPDDTIIVRDGTYTENLDVNKDHLTIQSQNGAESTIVEAANPDDHVFEVEGDYVSISGFTVQSATGVNKVGILLTGNYCDISNVIALNNYFGIYLSVSSHNTLINNVVLNNWAGIWLGRSSSNNLASNTLSDNDFNFGITGGSLSHFTQDIDTSNIVNGKPIQYLINRRDLTIDSSWDVGFLGLVNSTNVTIEDLTLANNGEGILLAYSTNSTVKNVNTVNNHYGVVFYYSYNNTITGSSVKSSYAHGIGLSASSNNMIHLNSFIDNANSVYSEGSTNFWHSPEEITYTYNGKSYTSYLGNYWSDYAGTDDDGDGIGETPYPIDSDADNYPLVEPFENYLIGGSGSGTKEDPYIITNVDELQAMNDNLGAWYELASDIDASPTRNWNEDRKNQGTYFGFHPIGKFTGHFDGKGHKITGLFINRPHTNYVGLFGYIDAGSEVKNVGLIAVDIKGDNWVSGLVGWNNYGTITNCYSRGSVNGNSSVGGLVGHNYGTITYSYSLVSVCGYGDAHGGLVGCNSYNGIITNCYFTGSVSGSSNTGGLAGYNAAGSITSSYSTGSVNAGGWDIGGLVGINWEATIVDCYSTMSVSGNDLVGGLVGENCLGTITNSYSAGNVSGKTFLGGLAGYNREGSFNNCFWDIETSGQTTSAGGTGKTTAEMKYKATFTNWDFDTVWDIEEGISYPFLRAFQVDDTTPPTVYSVSPEDSAADVPVDTVITATFSELMDSSTINTSSFTLAGSEVSGTVTYDPATYTATFTPDANLDYDHEYIATLSIAITDLAGNPLAEPYTWSFTTECAPVAKPVITSPLTIFASSAYYPYHVGDTLASTFSVTNRGGVPITFDILVVGGRVNNDVVDFDKAHGITLNPGESYDYVGNLLLENPGIYHFFCAYYIENPTEEEKELLDENNWNTAIPVEIEGEIITDPDEAQRYRATSIVVLEEATYIAPPAPLLWNEIHGPWEEISDDMIYEIRQIAVDPNDAEKIYIIVQYKQWGWPGGYWPNNEDIFKLSAGGWEEITGDMPFLIANAIAVASSDPNVIYVGGEKRGVYKSVNGGANWTSLEGPEVGWWIFKTKPRIFSLAVDSIDPNTVYVGTESGTWRKTDGEDWEQITGNVVTEIETNPYETGVIYANSIVKYSEGIYRSGGVLKSEDSGHSWKQKWTKGIANDIAIGEGQQAYVATGSYLTKFPLPGLVQAALIDFPVFADGILRYDGDDWEESANWHDARGKEGDNPLPDMTPYSVCAHPDYPNMVFVAFPHEGTQYSPNFGNDWFPLGLEGKGTAELLLAPDSNSPILYAHGPENLFRLQLSDTAIIVRRHSAGELRVYDAHGDVTGLVNGQVREEISDSMYYDGTVTIFSPVDSYRYEFLGTEEGPYGLEINFVEGEGVITFTAIDIPTTTGATHQYAIDWDALSQGEEGVAVQIDSDGDGKFEDTITSDEELSQDEFILQTETTVDFDPDTFNLKSKGKFVTVYIELPEGYNVEQIDVSSIRLNGTVQALRWPTEVGDYDSDGIPDLMVKFDRTAVQDILTPGSQVDITITGEVGGIIFEGSDTIRVIK